MLILAARANVSMAPRESVVSKEADKQISVSQSRKEEQILALPGQVIELETTETSESTAESVAAHTHNTEGQLLSPHRQSERPPTMTLGTAAADTDPVNGEIPLMALFAWWAKVSL